LRRKHFPRYDSSTYVTIICAEFWMPEGNE
jgi:hypothetical protein